MLDEIERAEPIVRFPRWWAEPIAPRSDPANWANLFCNEGTLYMPLKLEFFAEQIKMACAHLLRIDLPLETTPAPRVHFTPETEGRVPHWLSSEPIRTEDRYVYDDDRVWLSREEIVSRIAELEARFRRLEFSVADEIRRLRRANESQQAAEQDEVRHAGWFGVCCRRPRAATNRGLIYCQRCGRTPSQVVEQSRSGSEAA